MWAPAARRPSAVFAIPSTNTRKRWCVLTARCLALGRGLRPLHDAQHSYRRLGRHGRSRSQSPSPLRLAAPHTAARQSIAREYGSLCHLSCTLGTRRTRKFHFRTTFSDLARNFVTHKTFLAIAFRIAPALTEFRAQTIGIFHSIAEPGKERREQRTKGKTIAFFLRLVPLRWRIFRGIAERLCVGNFQ